MRFNRLRRLAVVVLLVVVGMFVTVKIVRADTGPKPTMSFEFVYEITPAPTIIAGFQEECDTADCSDAKPLQEAGPQRFTCSAMECSSMAYGYADYHRLSIEFSDGKTRQSNIFGKRFFDASYQVTVREADLLVEEQWGSNTNLFGGMSGLFFLCILLLVMLPLLVFLLLIAIRGLDFRQTRWLYILGWLSIAWFLAFALVIRFAPGDLLVTLFIELTLALVYALFRKRPVALVLTVVCMLNLITHPALSIFIGEFWFAWKYNLLLLLAAEAVIWLGEAFILGLALRKHIRFREALLLSLLLNAASFGIGLLLPF